MDFFSILFLFGMFAPALIRGAFWDDSPSVAAFPWLLVTWSFVYVVMWVTAKIFGAGLIPTISGTLALFAVIIYAIKGSTLVGGGGYGFDGDENE